MINEIIKKKTEEFDEEAKKKGMGGLARLFVKSFLSQSIRSVIEEAFKMTEVKAERAHTYASENADIYRAYDNGQNTALAEVKRKQNEFLKQ